MLEQPGTYARLWAAGDRLRRGLRAPVERHGVAAQVLGTGPLANVYFSAEPVVDYRSSLRADARMTQQLGRALLARGVLTNLAAKLYLSLAHSDADIDQAQEAFDAALGEVARRR